VLTAFDIYVFINSVWKNKTLFRRYQRRKTKFVNEIFQTLPKGTLGSVVSLVAATLYQGNPDRNHKFWNIVSSERYPRFLVGFVLLDL
jgi:hypothetical protein